MKPFNIRKLIIFFSVLYLSFVIFVFDAEAAILEVGQGKTYSTIQAAADVAQPGDTVLVYDGNYTGFMIQNSGTALAPITFKANGSNVYITSRNPYTSDAINVESWNANPANYIIIDGFKISNSPRDGIRVVGGRGVIIRNNIITNSQRFGILSGWTPEIQILNNISSNNNEHGIYVSNSNVIDDIPIVRGNIVFNNRQNGIQINGDICEGGDGLIRKAIVENNIIYNNNWKGLSLISISDSIVQNNLIYNNGISAGAGGIHIVQQVACPDIGIVYSNNNSVINNTVVEPRIAAIRINANNVNNVLFNNICISNNPIVLEGTGNYVDATSNLQRSSPSGIFVNSGAGDYHLSFGSPAIDTGRASYSGKNAPTVDIEGRLRPIALGFDIGAYEYGSDTIPPSPPRNLNVQ